MQRKIGRVLLGLLVVLILIWLFGGGGADLLFSGRVTVACTDTSIPGVEGYLRRNDNLPVRTCLEVSSIPAFTLLGVALVALFAPVLRRR